MKQYNSLCLNYFLEGYCDYGSECNFAHGIDQLKQYKTKMCKHIKHGECPYGVMCIFAHSYQELLEHKLRKVETENNKLRERIAGAISISSDEEDEDDVAIDYNKPFLRDLEDVATNVFDFVFNK